MKPLTGAALTWNVAVPPVEGALIAGLELVRVKSGVPGGNTAPLLPVSATDCGEFDATPVTVRLEAVPAEEVGENVT